MKKRNSLYKLANFYDAKKYLMDVTPTGPPPASRPEVESGGRVDKKYKQEHV